MENQSFNLTDQTKVFKEVYEKRSMNVYNSENVLDGRMKKNYKFTGRQKFVHTPLSFSGGVGSGKLPQSNAGDYEGAIIVSKKIYATCTIEREAIYASKDEKGAFVDATKETIKKTLESAMRNNSRILFNDGSGILGRGDGATNVTGLGTEVSPYLVTISDASWNEANFEEKDFVQVVSTLAAFPSNAGGSAEGGDAITNLLEVEVVDEVNKQVHLVGTSAVLAALAGVGPFPALSGLCMQRSYNRDPQGLKGIFDISESGVGSIYSIPVQRRWKAYILDASLEGVTTDMINGVMLKVKKQCGKMPNMIMASFEQYQNILALLEDEKVYNLPNKNLKGHMGFEGVEYVGAAGKKIGIFIDRFAKEDEIHLLMDEGIERYHRPGWGWFTDDGTVFLREQGEDDYNARYGGYYQNFIVPTGHAKIKNLAV